MVRTTQSRTHSAQHSNAERASVFFPKCWFLGVILLFQVPAFHARTSILFVRIFFVVFLNIPKSNSNPTKANKRKEKTKFNANQTIILTSIQKRFCTFIIQFTCAMCCLYIIVVVVVLFIPIFWWTYLYMHMYIQVWNDKSFNFCWITFIKLGRFRFLFQKKKT